VRDRIAKIEVDRTAARYLEDQQNLRGVPIEALLQRRQDLGTWAYRHAARAGEGHENGGGVRAGRYTGVRFACPSSGQKKPGPRAGSWSCAHHDFLRPLERGARETDDVDPRKRFDSIDELLPENYTLTPAPAPIEEPVPV
jgi:hypothetical protein